MTLSLFRAGEFRLVEITIKQCVHYCGFRYGHGEYHPYETYVKRLHRRDPLYQVRGEFERFLRFYRPRDLGQALGLGLSRQYPLWLYPWCSRWKYWRTRERAGWYASPDKIPDIITHFSEAGVPGWMIEKEYEWLHGAYESIASEGYKPEKYGYPHARVLSGYGGETAYLMLDGNHRISVLSALGYESVVVKYQQEKSVNIQNIDEWTGIKNGVYVKDDAANVFYIYFSGNPDYYKSSSPAAII